MGGVYVNAQDRTVRSFCEINMPDDVRPISSDTLLSEAAMAKSEPAGPGRALTAAPHSAAPAASPKPAPRRNRLRGLLLSAAVLGALGVGGHYGWNWYAEGRFM